MAPACQELAPGAELETLTVNGSSREKSKSSRLVFSTGGDGVLPPRAYFNLDLSLKRVSRLGRNRPRDRCSPQGASATLLSPDVCYWHKADSAPRPLFAVKETSLLDIAIYVCAS